MAYDERLARRVDAVLAERDDVRERKMFGGIAFMTSGNLCCGVIGEDLIVRLGEDGGDAALDEPHTRPMDFSGRPLKGWIYVAPAGTATDAALRDWIARALAFVETLPSKQRPSTLSAAEWHKTVASLPDPDPDFARDVQRARDSAGRPAGRWP